MQRFNKFLGFLLYFFICFLICMLFFHNIRFPLVNGDSMLPGYSDGDRLVVHYTQEASRGDVVVLWSDYLDEYVVKRVIAVEGENVVSDGQNILINGIILDEPYIMDDASDIGKFDVVVPADSFFVLGDNRDFSIDSRVFGCVNKSDMFGRVLFIMP